MIKKNNEKKFLQNTKEDSFWESFRDAINSNKRGQDGKIRILSIIALRFKYTDLNRELGVSSNYKISHNFRYN